MEKKIKAKDGFIINEPPIKIKNGNTRKSERIPAKQFPIRIQRQKINKLLLLLDFDSVRKESLSEKDINLLKLMALEGAMSNNIPSLRYNAILKLATFPCADTLNTLSYLAYHGEDAYIKSHALQALGHSGFELAIPVIAEHFYHKNIIISTAAQKALTTFAGTSGIERIGEYLALDKNLSNKIIEQLRDNLNKNKRKVRAQTRSKNAK